MKDVEKKLASWTQLHKQCEQLELAICSAPSSADRAVHEADLKRLKMEADEAFKVASEALHKKSQRSP